MAPAGEEGNSDEPVQRGLTRLGRAGGIVFFAKVGAAGLSFLMLAALARLLGPASFGEFTILRTLFLLLVGLVGPAIDTALVRFGARELAHGPERFASTVRAAIRAKALLAGLFLAAGVLLTYPLHTSLFASTSAIRTVHIAVVFWGAAAMLFVDLFRAILQTRQHFTTYALVEFLIPVFRAVSIAGLAILGMMTAGPYMAAYVLAPIILAMVLRRRVLPQQKSDSRASIGNGKSMDALRRFAGWVLVACICTSLAQNLDMLLLGVLEVPRNDVGGYGAARTLMQVGDLAVLSLFSVMLPHASGLRTPRAMGQMLRTWTPLLAGMCLIPLPLLSQLPWIMGLVFGEEYARFAPVLGILLIGTLLSVVSAPAGAIVYGAGQPRIIAILEGLKLTAILLGSWWLLPERGIVGMACIVAAAKGTIGVLTLGAAIWITRSGRIGRVE